VSRTTGTIRPLGLSTAMPMLRYFFWMTSPLAMSMLLAKCGNSFKALVTALMARMVMVTLPGWPLRLSLNFLRAASVPVMSARSNWVTRGMSGQVAPRPLAVALRTPFSGNFSTAPHLVKSGMGGAESDPPPEPPPARAAFT
jgi:hypothetical protein